MADSESTQEKSKAPRASAAKGTDPEPEQQTADDGNGNGDGSEDTAPPIPVSQLVADGSALLGQPSWVVAGALSGRPADEGMEIDAASSLVDAWLQQAVEVDQREGEEG